MTGPWEGYSGQGPWTAYAEKPELGEFDLPFEFSGRQAKTALGMLTTYDPKDQLAILKQNYPDLQFYQDEKGEIIVDGNAYGGEPGYLNKPGVSGRDVLQAGFVMAGFTPAGRAVKAATIPLRMAQAGGATAAIQGVMEGTNTLLGGNTDVGEAATNVAVAALGGAAAEGLFSFIAPKVGPAVAKWRMNRNNVTPDVRESMRLELMNAGVPESQINDSVILTALQHIANKTGKKYGDVSAQMVDEAASAVRQGDMPPIAPPAITGARNQALSEEFNVPLSRGQTIEDIAQLTSEDAMRNGARGEKAQAIVRAFDAAQDNAIAGARRGVQASLSGRAAPQVESVAQGTGAASDAIRAAERAMDAQVDAAYGRVGDAFLSPKGVRGLVQRVRQSVRGVDFNPNLPQTSQILAEGQNLTKLIDSFGGQLKPFHLKQLEAYRRRINGAIESAKRADPTDMRQLVVMKKAFDDYINQAVDGALFSGDDGAIAALKEARELRAAYARKFQPNPARSKKTGKEFRDEAGDLIERIVYANPSNEEVANALFGVSKIAKPASHRIAARFKTILGKDSPEWHAIREAAFLRLTGGGEGLTAKSAQVLSTRLADAVHGDGAPLMKELFSDAEIKLFSRYATLLKKTDPFGGPANRARLNPSGTGYTNAQSVLKLLSVLVRGAGMTGEPAAMAAGGAASAITGRAGVSAAQQAVAPIVPKPPTHPFGRFTASGLPIMLLEDDAQN